MPAVRAYRICLSTDTYPPAPGGVSVAARRVARLLHEAGHDVHVVTPVSRAGAAGEVERSMDDGVHVHRVFHADTASLRGYLAQRQCVRDLDREKPFDAFHGFFLPAAAPCLEIAALGPRPRPVIASIRGSDAAVLLGLPSSRPWLLRVLRQSTWLTSVSDEALAIVARDTKVEGRSCVIRNSVAAPDAASCWRLSADTRGVVGTVGDFRKVKDIPLLIRAYATVPAELRRGLLLAGAFRGAEDEEAWSKTLIDELGLGGQAELTGRFPHDQLPAYLGRLGVFVQSSAHEGMPNALIEAAARGIPIVATAVGAARELFVDGESALLVPHGDRDQMGAAIRRVLEDDELAVRLSRGGRAVAGQLSPERERDAWLALYRHLIDGVPLA